MMGGQRDNLLAATHEEWTGADLQRAHALCCHLRKGRIEFAFDQIYEAAVEMEVLSKVVFR